MSEYLQIKKDSTIPVYPCDPHSPWQRGSNENTNGLVRQYFPQGTNLNQHSRERLAEVAAKINGRHRESRNWEPTQAHFDRLKQQSQFDQVMRRWVEDTQFVMAANTSERRGVSLAIETQPLRLSINPYTTGLRSELGLHGAG